MRLAPDQAALPSNEIFANCSEDLVGNLACGPIGLRLNPLGGWATDSQIARDAAQQPKSFRIGGKVR
jgi:hypothetical protein